MRCVDADNDVDDDVEMQMEMRLKIDSFMQIYQSLSLSGSRRRCPASGLVIKRSSGRLDISICKQTRIGGDLRQQET